MAKKPHNNAPVLENKSLESTALAHGEVGSPQTKRKNSKKNLLFLVAVIVAIGSGGFFALRSSANSAATNYKQHIVDSITSTPNLGGADESNDSTAAIKNLDNQLKQLSESKNKVGKLDTALLGTGISSQYKDAQKLQQQTNEYFNNATALLNESKEYAKFVEVYASAYGYISDTKNSDTPIVKKTRIDAEIKEFKKLSLSGVEGESLKEATKLFDDISVGLGQIQKLIEQQAINVFTNSTSEGLGGISGGTAPAQVGPIDIDAKTTEILVPRFKALAAFNREAYQTSNSGLVKKVNEVRNQAKAIIKTAQEK